MYIYQQISLEQVSFITYHLVYKIIQIKYVISVVTDLRFNFTMVVYELISVRVFMR